MIKKVCILPVNMLKFDYEHYYFTQGNKTVKFDHLMPCWNPECILICIYAYYPKIMDKIHKFPYIVSYFTGEHGVGC